jgi:hypothetical protein
MAGGRRRVRLLWLLAGCGAGLLLVLVFLLAALNPDPSVLSTGPQQHLADAAFSAAGGTYTLSGSATSLDGLTLEIPASAYKTGQVFSITAAEIRAHDLGPLFEPATPLITIDNGHRVAAVPLRLTIPITRADDEFVLAFYYDARNGRLEGIPCLTQDNQSLTLLTTHFSDIVVSRVKKSLLEGRILESQAQSGFLPGRDDFASPNDCSYAAPGGLCSGLVLGALHYYNSASGKPLRQESRVDNGLYADTPDFWEDDALAYRLASLLQKQLTWTEAMQREHNRMSEDVTYYALAYAIALTESPQVLLTYGTDVQNNRVGHALVVYDVTPDGLAVADPNYPGDRTRRIRRIDQPDGNRHTVTLDDYWSGTSTEDPGTLFTDHGYIGTYALFDRNHIDRLWQEVLAGRDVAASLFPADLTLVAVTGRDEQGRPLTTHLQTELTISPAQAGMANPAGSDSLLIAPARTDPADRLTYYRGSALLGTANPDESWFALPLRPGDNAIGLLYERQDATGRYRYVNFYRLNIRYTDALPTPTASPTPEPARSPTPDTTKPAKSLFEGRWALTGFEVTGISGGADSFWREIRHNGGDPMRWADLYLGNFSSILAHSENYGPGITYLAELRIGPPIWPHGEQYDGNLFFQTNRNITVSQLNIVVDGKKRISRQETFPAEPIDAQTLRVTGFDSFGGQDINDLYYDFTVNLSKAGQAEGGGSVIIRMESVGQIEVAFTLTMKRTSNRSGLVAEYE